MLLLEFSAFSSLHLVIRDGTNLEVKVYKKNKTNGSIHSLKLLCSTKYKGISNFGINKTKLVCTESDYLAEELQYIKKTLMLNGYPKNFIGKEITKH